MAAASDQARPVEEICSGPDVSAISTKRASNGPRDSGGRLSNRAKNERENR